MALADVRSTSLRAASRITVIVAVLLGLTAVARPASASSLFQIYGIGADEHSAVVFSDGSSAYPAGGSPGTTAAQWYRVLQPGTAVDFWVDWNEYYGTPAPPTTEQIDVVGPCGSVYSSASPNASMFITSPPPMFGVIWRTSLPLSVCTGTYTATVKLTNTNNGDTQSGTLGFYVGFRAPPSIPTQQTLGCGNPTGTKNPSAKAGDPVDTASGSYCEQITDVRLPGTGVPFSFTRNYNSLDTMAGSLGTGWAAPFDTSLIIANNGNVTLRASDGQQATYTANGDGTFTPGAGARSVLRRVPTSGEFTLTTPGQLQYAFDPAGNLTSFKSRDGQGLSFTRSNGRIVSAVDAANRTATFSYAPTSNLLTALTLADGRTVNYGYTAGQLTTVTDLRGKIWSYAYDTAGRLTSMTDPLGHVRVRNAYDSTTGRVSSQADALGNVTTFAWDPTSTTATITDPRGNQTTDRYSGNVLVKHTDPLGHATAFDYDASLNVVQTTDALGNATRSSYDKAGNLLSRQGPAPSSYSWSYTYDAINDPLTVVDPLGNTTTNVFDGFSRLTQSTDPLGRISKRTFTANGLVATTTDALGAITNYGYDASGNRTTVKTPLGNTTAYGYDSSGRLTSVTDPRGAVAGTNAAAYTRTVAYDTADNVVADTDARGLTTRFSYDAAGRKVSKANAIAQTTMYGYDDDNRATTVTNPAGSTTTSSYDAAGNVTAVTTPTGKTTFGYDAANNRTTIVSANGNLTGATPSHFTTTYGYDAANQLLTVQQPNAALTTYTRDELGRATAVKDPNGHVSSTTYDGNGRATAQMDATGQVTKLAYDKAGELISATDARGFARTYSYDADGHRTAATTPTGNRTSWSYDTDGRQVSVVDPRGNVAHATPAMFTTTSAYDAAADLTARTDPLGHKTTWTYDQNGDRSSQTDPNGHTNNFAYDELNRIKTVTAADGGTTSYSYDTAGNTAGRTDANGHTTTFGYDLSGHLTSRTDALGRNWTYGYDANGNTLTVRTGVANSGGKGTITKSYDASDQLSATSYDDGTPPVVYTYDPAGNITSVNDAGGLTSLGYDAADRLTSVASAGKQYTYTYDAEGNIASRQYPDTTAISYAYNNENRLATVTTGGAATSFSYDPAGDLTSATLPLTTGYASSLTYDAAQRLTGLTNSKGNAIISKFAVSLDPAGNPTSIARTRGGSTTSDISTFDAADRLSQTCFSTTTCTGATSSVGYSYDKVGNRLSQTRTGVTAPGTTTYGYDASDELATASAPGGITTYGYDANGNQTAAGPRSSVYTVAGQLLSTTANGTTDRYSYDAAGNRLTQTVNGALTTRNSWDINGPLSQLATEQDGAGILLRRYIQGPLGAISMTAGTSGAYYFLTDPYRNVSDLISSTGTAQYNDLYEPFGLTRTENKLVSTAPTNPLHFAGQYQDADTGLYQMRARYYDPAIGQFTASDPLSPNAEQPFQSTYGYTEGRPTFAYDPSGQSGCLLGRRATNDPSCQGGGLLSDIVHATKNVASALFDSVPISQDCIDSAGNPGVCLYGAAKAAARGCGDGYRSNGGGGMGVLGCLDQFNPVYHALQDGQQLINDFHSGCADAAGRDALSLSFDTAQTVAAVAGGTSAAATVGRAAEETTVAGRSLNELSQQGAQADRNGLTQAGRALQKHANRAGNSAYPKVPGGELNGAGQDVLDEILTNPMTAERSYVSPNYGPVREFLLPDMGARFEKFGRLIGFL